MRSFKLLLIGEHDVGKEGFLFRYIKEAYVPNPRLRIGVDFYWKKIRLKDSGQTVKLKIWDFAGEKRFRFLLPTYSKNADACFFVFDLTRKETLESIDEWLRVVYENAGEIPVILVGTKPNFDDQPEILDKEILRVVEEKGLHLYFDSCANSSQNIMASFELITELITATQDL